MFLEAVSTINDLEGWQNGLKWCAKGRSQVLLYTFIQLLHREATLVNLHLSGFRQKAQETSTVGLQSHAEKTIRPLEAV